LLGFASYALEKRLPWSHGAIDIVALAGKVAHLATVFGHVR